MPELKAWTTRQSTGEEPVRYSIHFDRFPSLKMTRIISDRYPSVTEQMRIYDNIVVDFAAHLLSTSGKAVEPDSYDVRFWTKLKWTSFLSHRMGRGVVAFEQSEKEKGEGQYNPHGVLIHENEDSSDPDIMRVVENECAMLAYLLNKFRFDNEFISEHAKSCVVYPEVMRLPEFKWNELPAGTYKIRGILKTGRAPYTLVYEEGDRKDEFFLHNVEPTAQIDDSLLDTEVVATVLKHPDCSAELLAVESYTKL